MDIDRNSILARQLHKPSPLNRRRTFLPGCDIWHGFKRIDQLPIIGFEFLNQLTGKPIIADTSFGVTTMQDSWSTASAATLNERIGDGVAGVLIYPTPGDYQQRINGLAPQLASTCP